MDALSAAPVTAILIAINVAASLYAFAQREFLDDNTLHVGPVRAGQWGRTLTSGFLHVNTGHLLLNMFVLLQFGLLLEPALGPVDFLILYFASLLGGGLWALLDNWRRPDYRAVGASGAISGLVAAYCLFLPKDTLWLFALIPMQASWLLILFLAGSAYFSTRAHTIISHEAHFGGAIAGAGVTLSMAPATWGRFFNALTESIS